MISKERIGEAQAQNHNLSHCRSGNPGKGTPAQSCEARLGFFPIPCEGPAPGRALNRPPSFPSGDATGE